MNDDYTTKDIFEEAKRHGRRVIKIASIPELGITNAQDFVLKMLELRERAIAAYDKQCYIEYLSLLLLYIEVWLRIYLFGKNAYSGMNMRIDRIMFGTLIDRSEKAGLEKDIVDELRFLNSLRINYVHSYLKKPFDYIDFTDHRGRVSKIPPILEDYVSREIGVEVKDESEIGITGDIVRVL